MPMLASDTASLPGMGAGSAGFSMKVVISRSLSIPITPQAEASARGISMQPTVQPRPRSAWSLSISE